MIVVYHKAKEVFQKNIVSNTFTYSNSHTQISLMLYMYVFLKQDVLIIFNNFQLWRNMIHFKNCIITYVVYVCIVDFRSAIYRPVIFFQIFFELC